MAVKIELKGAQSPWSSILLLVTVASKKMLKRNWNWRNSRLFWHIFVIGEISIWRVSSLVPLLWLRLRFISGKQKRYLQIFREVSGVFQQNFDDSKNNAVLEPRTGQFSRTWGLEAKAKNFKMCPRGRPRGQGRPQGLHLWKKVFHFWWRPFFWSSLNLLTWTNSWSRFIPPMLKIGQNWGKIANYPPQCSKMIGTPGPKRFHTRGSLHLIHQVAFPRDSEEAFSFAS